MTLIEKSSELWQYGCNLGCVILHEALTFFKGGISLGKTCDIGGSALSRIY
jgi:hypothetical protein